MKIILVLLLLPLVFSCKKGTGNFIIKGKITDEKGAPIDYDTWLAANLRWMNLSPKNIPDLKDQVLTMETKKQEGKVNKWFLKGISTLSND